MRIRVSTLNGCSGTYNIYTVDDAEGSNPVLRVGAFTPTVDNMPLIIDDLDASTIWHSTSEYGTPFVYVKAEDFTDSSKYAITVALSPDLS